jgi:hypothetical protein
MTRATVLQEVRQIRFEELYVRRQCRELSMAEAAELQDRRLGRPSGWAVPVDEVLRMVTLYETRYTGWTVKHFHERWHAEHGGSAPIPGRKRPFMPRGRWPGPSGAGPTAKSGLANRCWA